MFQPPTAYSFPFTDPRLQTPLAPEKKLRTFEERNITVSRTARYAVLGSLDAELSEVWFVCHGQGQLARRFLSRFLPLERTDRLFIAPEALSRYYLLPARGGPHPPDAPIGANWMTYEDREADIADYVNYLDVLHDEVFSVVDRSSVRLWVLGFSQGVATAARWVARGRVEPDRVVFCSGVLPPEMDAARASRLTRRAPLMIALGTDDEFARPSLIAQQEARLHALGISHQTLRFDGGHEIVPEVLTWLVETAV